ncbi:hypothetical protein K4F52_000208 [Lecanicillium sp. MT-2017a]|nr:hypothetical protein K4F52_000208 [Lecanicillium sp. MT-2017a]
MVRDEPTGTAPGLYLTTAFTWAQQCSEASFTMLYETPGLVWHNAIGTAYSEEAHMTCYPRQVYSSYLASAKGDIWPPFAKLICPDGWGEFEYALCASTITGPATIENITDHWFFTESPVMITATAEPGDTMYILAVPFDGTAATPISNPSQPFALWLPPAVQTSSSAAPHDSHDSHDSGE